MMKTPSASRLAQYGLTVPEYLALWEAQGGKCPICTKRFTRSRHACVDHNHRTGEVRGLLCGPCNLTIGELHEDTEWLWNAFTYLEQPPSREVFLTPRTHVNAPPPEGVTP